MEKIYIQKINETYLRVFCEQSIEYELKNHFTFDVPGAKFSPKFRSGQWNGQISLFNLRSKQIYCGLLHEIKEFAEVKQYEVIVQDEIPKNKFTVDDAEEYIEYLKLPFKLREYQVEGFAHAIRNKRALLLSPTASGKSAVIYLITRFLEEKTLIIVPSINLTAQMFKDFEDYGYDSNENIHLIYGGQEKDSNKNIIFSTWQSIINMKPKELKEWIDQFNCIIVDEAHSAKAKSLQTIMELAVNCEYRFGFTGTLDGSLTSKLVCEGLFGPVKQLTTTEQLIKDKHISDLEIKAILLKYSDESCKTVKGFTYPEESDFLITHNKRNKFIKDLSLKLKNNTLLLFKNISHGKTLYDLINGNKKKVYFVYGGTELDEREEVRKIVEKENNCVIIASYGVYSQGINIKNLHNIIFGSPSKSRIRVLQSIGRGLRLNKDKESCILYDICDDLHWKSKENHTLRHFKERIKIYNSEKFNYKIHTINLE